MGLREVDRVFFFAFCTRSYIFGTSTIHGKMFVSLSKFLRNKDHFRQSVSSSMNKRQLTQCKTE